MKLEKRVALVVGGAGSMGSSVARTFAENGAIVCVADIDKNRAEEVSKQICKDGGQSIFMGLDVCDSGDWDEAVEIDDWIIVQCYKKIDADTFTEMYNDIFLKKYTTAMFKKQWGQNLIKFEGMQLPGGATLNGRQIYDDGVAELERLDEDLNLKYALPDQFYVG